MKTLFKLFFVTLLLGTFTFFKLNDSPKPAYAQASSCTASIVYANGQTVTNTQIVIGQAFSVQANISVAGSYELVVSYAENGQIKEKKFAFISPGQSISIASNQIYGATIPNQGDPLSFAIDYQGTTANACSPPITFSYSFVTAAATCQGSLSVNSSTLTEKATGCNGQVARVDLLNTPQTQTISTKNITSDNWSSNLDISAYQKNWANAILYICNSSNPNCNNEVGRVGLQNVASGCPIFSSYNPITLTSSDNIQVQYLPLAGAKPTDFVVTVNNNGSIQNFNLIFAFNRWVTSIGQYSAGTKLQIGLFRLSDNFQCDAKQLTINGLLVPGKNPCGVNCETALGPIGTDLQSFAAKLLSIAIGLAGGFALILMVRGSISVLTSGGDPQKVNSGREVIVAAVAGLLFLIFSVLILNFIGLKILTGVPGL